MAKAKNIAFIAPRFSEKGTIGGAETLLKNLAERAAAAGRNVTMLTTCAESHFTWENVLPPGRKRIGQIDVEFFPVDKHRNIESFLRVQEAISGGGTVTHDDELTWIKNSVNSQRLCDHLVEHGKNYDRIVVGPYLFGITYFASRIHPEKTFLVPCLHDESFAYLSIIKEMFANVAGYMFNTEPEQELAQRIVDAPEAKSTVVGMGLDPFEVDGRAFTSRHGISLPYVLYSGRREVLKGTPLLIDYVHTFRERTGRNIKLVFTGSGEYHAPPEMEPHIIDVGFVSEQEKHEAMAGALAFCHPSVNESLGIVLLEAWLARTPALVHAKSAVLQWQCRRSGGGFWFRGYPDFEEELLVLMTHPEIRQAMRDAGHQYVLDAYAWPRVEERMFTALDGHEKLVKRPA